MKRGKHPESFAFHAPPAPVPANRIPLNEKGRRDWLRLARAKHVGPVGFRTLLRRFSSAGEAIAALPEMAARAGAKRRPELPSMAAVEAELAAGRAMRARLLLLGARDYPPMLAQIYDPPPVLWAMGDPGLLTRPGVAIVGARNASANGIRLTRLLARALGRAGYCIVSGMAAGIDNAAHKAMIAAAAQGDTAGGATIAVLAGGADVIYPSGSEALWGDIRSGGLILSEAAMGQQPTARMFPRRNRIISGLSLGCVIVEAAERSGSLITARCALEQGREVMAVPGSPLDPRSAGCNRLIREGALLARHADDILEALEEAKPRAIMGETERDTEPEEARVSASEVSRLHGVLDGLLGAHPVAIDDLIQQTGASVAAVTVALLEMELAGRITRHPGAMVSLLFGGEADADEQDSHPFIRPHRDPALK